MERFFYFYFINLCLVLWLAEAVLRKSLRDLNGWAMRIGPGIILLATMAVDSMGRAGGMPSALLASDIMFLIAAFLQSFSVTRDKVVRCSLSAAAFSTVCLIRSILEAAGLTLHMGASDITVLTMVMMLASCAVTDCAGYSASHNRQVFRLPADSLELKITYSQLMLFAGIIILVLAHGGFSFSRVALLVLSLLLSLLYVYLYLITSFGKPVIGLPAISGASKSSGGENEDKKMDDLFKKVEEYMRKELPYLDNDFTLAGLASEMLTNKGMLSRTVNVKSGRNFCQYVNRYRIDYAVSLMKKDHRLKVTEISLMSGFRTIPSFNMAFKLFMNETPSEYMRSLQAEKLQQERLPPDHPSG